MYANWRFIYRAAVVTAGRLGPLDTAWYALRLIWDELLLLGDTQAARVRGLGLGPKLFLTQWQLSGLYVDCASGIWLQQTEAVPRFLSLIVESRQLCSLSVSYNASIHTCFYFFMTASGVFPPWSSDQRLCPWTRYNLALHACHVGLHILNSDAAYGVIGVTN